VVVLENRDIVLLASKKKKKKLDHSFPEELK